MLTDTFGRKHNYLRVSLTGNCNLRCFYCMPEEDYEVMPSAQLMQADEIAELAQTFVRLGVTKIRLTGGEPLVRKDAAAIIRLLSRLPIDLTLTTNGVRLHEYLPVLKNAGIRSLNISLDTLDKEKFQLITRRNHFSRVWENIHLMIDNGIKVKVNVVVMKGLNDQEINEFVSWTKETPVAIRFIEFMPFAGNRWTSNKVFTWQEILKTIESQHAIVRLFNDVTDTAKEYRVPGYAGSFGVISTMSAPFCSGCNRMRLTADGKMKNCLFSKEEVDLLTPLRRQENIEELIRQCIRGKAAERGGQFTAALEMLEAAKINNRSMISIGG